MRRSRQIPYNLPLPRLMAGNAIKHAGNRPGNDQRLRPALRLPPLTKSSLSRALISIFARNILRMWRISASPPGSAGRSDLYGCGNDRHFAAMPPSSPTPRRERVIPALAYRLRSGKDRLMID